MKTFTNVARIGYLSFVPNDLFSNDDFPSKFFCSTRKIRRMEKNLWTENVNELKCGEVLKIELQDKFGIILLEKEYLSLSYN